MKNRNTGLLPQTVHKEAANTIWVLRNADGKVIRTGEPEELDFDPIVNAEGQTQSEWKRDLVRRQREEVLGDLSEFATDGLGYILTAIFKVVIVIVKLPVMFVGAACQPRAESFGGYVKPKSEAGPTVNVNVEVTGSANVNVNVKVNK